MTVKDELKLSETVKELCAVLIAIAPIIKSPCPEFALNWQVTGLLVEVVQVLPQLRKNV